MDEIEDAVLECKNCNLAHAEVNFTWPTSSGHQSADLCAGCAKDWWDKYAHSASGMGVTIGPVKSADEHVADKGRE